MSIQGCHFRNLLTVTLLKLDSHDAIYVHGDIHRELNIKLSGVSQQLDQIVDETIGVAHLHKSAPVNANLADPFIGSHIPHLILADTGMECG